MPSSTPMSRLAAVLALLLVPSLAGAREAARPRHTELKRSEPARDSRLNVAPSRLTLWFTAKPQLAFSRIRLVGPSGDIPLGPVVSDTGDALYARVHTLLPPGGYRVSWQTASADGHPIRGEFGFMVVASGAAALEPVPTVQAADRAGVSQGPVVEHVSEYRTARWIEFVGLLTILGALGFRHAVLPPLASRGVATSDAADRARRLGQGALALYAIAASVRLVTESVALHGSESALEAGVLLPLLTETTWGVGWLAGIIGAALLFAGWRLSKRTTAIGTPLALTGALGMVLSPALSGHAAASRQFVLSVTLDMLHVAAAGVWIGGLMMVLVAGIPAMRRLTDGNTDAAVGALVSSFHPLALFCAPLVVMAGLGTSWIRLGGFGGLQTAYGRTLLVKLALFALVAGMGTYNALRARRRLGAAGGTRHFRATGAVELFFAALVLAATTVLVISPVPSDMVTP